MKKMGMVFVGIVLVLAFAFASFGLVKLNDQKVCQTYLINPLSKMAMGVTKTVQTTAFALNGQRAPIAGAVINNESSMSVQATGSAGSTRATAKAYINSKMGEADANCLDK